MTSKKLLFIFLFSLLILNFSSFSAVPKISSTVESIENFSVDSTEWKSLNQTVQHSTFYFKSEKAICHIVKIDLNSPELKITSLPSPEKNKIVSHRPAFLSQKNKIDVIINTMPYSQKVKGFSKKIPVGILQLEKKQFYPANGKYCALAIFQDNGKYSAQIFESQLDTENLSESQMEKLVFIHGGFWQILKDGSIFQFKDIKDSRTAAGISKDKRFLFLLLVEGEVKSKSQGLSYMECAQIFKKLDVENAMEFDGGTSTCLMINRKNMLTYPKNPYLPAFIGFSFTKNE